MTYAAISEAADAQHLEILGAFHPGAGDNLDAATLLLLGPRESGFWAHFKSSPEGCDGARDPLDRWSQRIISGLASEFGAKAVFPFGGPPYHPFFQWALRSGRSWVSPVTLLVNDVQGMMVSFRGAILLPDKIDLPSSGTCPCTRCADQPCRRACPVDALHSDRFDVKLCKEHVASAAGQDCRMGGCLARRACPVSQSYGRLAAQSAHHMEYFL